MEVTSNMPGLGDDVVSTLEAETFAPLEDLPRELPRRNVADPARVLECPLTARFINDIAIMASLPGFIYVASPYTKFPGGITTAFQDVAKLTAELVKAGMSVYSPICHSHPIAMLGGIDPLDHTLWMDQCAAMMQAASGCIVLQMPGWQDSVGVGMEVEYFRKANKPVLFVEPERLIVPNARRLAEIARYRRAGLV